MKKIIVSLKFGVTRALVSCVSLNILLIGEECGRLQMYAHGVVHIGTIDFTQLGIPNASFIYLFSCLLFLFLVVNVQCVC